MNVLTPVWNTAETTEYLRHHLTGYRKLSPKTVCHWAYLGLIPANRHGNRWFFEPVLIDDWIRGEPILHQFHLAKDPRRALAQIRELVAYLCRSANQEGNPFFEGRQEDLCIAVRTVLRERGYFRIRQAVRDLYGQFRENSGLGCLESVEGLF